MLEQRTPIVVLGLVLVLVLGAGCGGTTLDDNVATLNAAATKAAEGNIMGGGDNGGGQAGGESPEPTIPPNLHDLTVDPYALLATAWGQVYGLSQGSEFTILATQQQVADFIVDSLQLAGWSETVRGGTVSIGMGQLRLDVALLDTEGSAGGGTVTFQPTLDAMGRLKLNSQGADFGGLTLPGGLVQALGDAVHTALTGARNDSLSQVTLSRLSLESEVLEVSGTRR